MQPSAIVVLAIDAINAVNGIESTLLLLMLLKVFPAGFPFPLSVLRAYR